MNGRKAGNSKCIAPAELNNSRREGRTDSAEVRRADTGEAAAADCVKLRVIECIQELRAKFKRLVFPNGDPLECVDIPVGVARPVEHISSECAQAAGAECGA